jgi:hypothetical protein
VPFLIRFETNHFSNGESDSVLLRGSAKEKRVDNIKLANL